MILLFDVSQCAARVALGITEGLAAIAAASPRGDALLCSCQKVQGDVGGFSLPL